MYTTKLGHLEPSSAPVVQKGFTIVELLIVTVVIAIPAANGPIPGDTGSGTTNYGYLYNWSAATAGETRESISTGDAPYSICPSNWRLPTGGAADRDFGQLDVALGGTGMYTAGSPSIAMWQFSGPLKGVFAGYKYYSLGDQGAWGYLWSDSPVPGSPEGAVGTQFGLTHVYPGSFSSGSNRGDSLAVRCLLN